MQSDGVPATAPGVPTFSWSKPDGMIRLSVFNYVMRIITLGIYHFWGKTEERRRIWSAIRLNGEPIRYHGTGKELFLGLLVVIGVVFIPMMLISLAGMLMMGPVMGQLMPLIIYPALFFLLGAGIYRAQRYRLSRSTWRGIRGGMDGKGWDYAWTHLWTGVLVPFTLGWIMPWRTVKLQSMLTSQMRFGDQHFAFDASAGHLYRRYPLVWFGGLVLFVGAFAGWGFYIYGKYGDRLLPQENRTQEFSLDTVDIAVMIAVFSGAYLIYLIISAWYRAQVYNYFAAHTTYAGAPLSGSMQASSLAWLDVTNYMMVLLTFGILTPVAQMRAARYMVENTAFTAPVDFELVAQRAAETGKLGEGVAQAFDIDAF